MKVRLHKVENQVDVFWGLGFYYGEEGDDVGVSVQLLQEDYLAVGALGVGCVLECVEYFF